ncbi:hypothetical protein V1514DRAFT_112434 [Lipomyces japonicus]|uniref:uncharacterized protein n=1 Tax=Lipomyces japonicus TaxID=56871 RepID=UPI0034CFD58A
MPLVLPMVRLKRFFLPILISALLVAVIFGSGRRLRSLSSNTIAHDNGNSTLQTVQTTISGLFPWSFSADRDDDEMALDEPNGMPSFVSSKIKSDGSLDLSEIPPHCRDPYRVPGYLYVPENKHYLHTQWIPFLDTNFLDVPDPKSAEYPTDVIPFFTDAPPPDTFIERSPHNWFAELYNYRNILKHADEAANGKREKLSLSDSQQRLFRRLNWIHNRRVLVLGDSVDRIMIQFFCEDYESHAHFTQGSFGGQHTTYNCHIPSVNLTISHWHVASLYPMRPSWWWLDHIRLVAFEDRFEKLFKPVWDKVIGMNGQTPDLIIFQSGLWDERAFRESSRNFKYPEDEKLSKEQLEKKMSERRKSGLGKEGRQLAWDELVFFKSRMAKFMRYLREKFGAQTPMLYRSLTTRRDSNVADLATINMDRISRLIAQREGVEIFEWARLTSGFSDQYMDYLHVGRGPLSATWGNMMLYYLFRASGGINFNGTIERYPDFSGNYLVEGKGAINVPVFNVKENPDVSVNNFWAECHAYNVFWGGR